MRASKTQELVATTFMVWDFETPAWNELCAYLEAFRATPSSIPKSVLPGAERTKKRQRPICRFFYSFFVICKEN